MEAKLLAGVTQSDTHQRLQIADENDEIFQERGERTGRLSRVRAYHQRAGWVDGRQQFQGALYEVTDMHMGVWLFTRIVAYDSGGVCKQFVGVSGSSVMNMCVGGGRLSLYCHR